MTPLSKSLARLLPAPLVAPALAVLYAAMMMAILIVGSSGSTEIAYIDVRNQ